MRQFSDLASFIAHFATIHTAVAIQQNRAMERVASKIERDAKARIGHYQDAAGPFPEWAPLADSTEAEKKRLGYKADAPLMRDGELRESIQHEVKGTEAIVGSKSPIAAYQEFGTGRVPARPFIGPAAFDNKRYIEEQIGQATVVGLTGGKLLADYLK